jgi:CBS domain containing-hemolysin-like protein
MYNNEKLSLAYSIIIYFIMQVLTPIIFIMDKISGFFLSLLHIDSSQKATITETELKTYVDVSHEDGVIEQEEKKLIYNVFEFGDSVAKDIMVPRIDMTTVDVNATYDEVFDIFKKSMYTRIPVYEGEIDNIIGIIIVKDFLMVNDKNDFRIRDIMREGYYTYEYKKTADLLIEMRLITTNVAIVLNEYGAAVGMITVEDLLEEIVGEIRDEFDEDEEELLKELGKNEYEVSGSMKLDDINETLGTSFESKEYDSIGGVMIELLDRFPTQGEAVEIDNGITLIANRVENNRIESVLIKKKQDGMDLQNIP